MKKIVIKTCDDCSYMGLDCPYVERDVGYPVINPITKRRPKFVGFPNDCPLEEVT